jgi:AcrR family transcriptional regulator
MTDASTPVRLPKQKRSRDSLARVLDAASALLEQNGFDAFTINEVSDRARVSVGAIYARFGSKENLLRAVHRRTMERLEEEHSPLVRDLGPDAAAADVIAAAVRAVARIFRSHDQILRAFMHIGAIDHEIQRRGSEGSTALSKAFKAVILTRRGTIAHRDPELAVDVAFRMTFRTFAREVMYGPVFDSDRSVAWDELVREVSAACVAYLVGRAAI